MSILTDILTLSERIDAALGGPRVRRVFVPEPAIAADKDAEFGVIELEDGAVGLFYAWMGESQAGISSRFLADSLAGLPAIELARQFAGDDDMARSIGLAAINALTQSLFTRAGYEPPTATDSMAGLALGAGDHLGLVGYFPSLVRRAHAQAIPVTVVERKSHLLRDEPGCTITLDASRLSHCNKIVCTAATLINASVDDMLAYCDGAEIVAMLGPSASFPPEPVFERGVSIIGGSRISDARAAIDGQLQGRGLRDCARRYVITRAAWPGLETLIARATSE